MSPSKLEEFYHQEMQFATTSAPFADRDSRFWLIAFLVVATLLITTHRHWSSQAGGFTPSADRRTLPDVALTQLDGSHWRLADHRGQVVLINYWATWCEPCREELPGLTQVARDSGPKGLAVVGVSLDDGPDAQSRVRQFATRFHIPYPVAFPDPTQHHGAREMGIPTTVLLDRQGRVVKTYTGAVERSDFAKDVAALLAES